MNNYPIFTLKKYKCVHVKTEDHKDDVIELRKSFYENIDPRINMYTSSTEDIDVFLIYTDDEPMATFAVDRNNVLLKSLQLPKLDDNAVTSLLYGIKKSAQGLNRSVIFFVFLHSIINYLKKTGVAAASAPRIAQLFQLITGGQVLGEITNYLNTGVDYKYIYGTGDDFYDRHHELCDQVVQEEENIRKKA